jgi:transcription elongation factor S-II
VSTLSSRFLIPAQHLPRSICTCADKNGDADSPPASDLILKRAVAIEAAVLDAHGPGSSAAYKTRLRSLLVNLKDRANPGLRASVVSGDLPAARFAGMSSEDMASEERKAENARIQEENLFKTYAAGEREAETDQFQCGRCKQRKCRYRQAQTRSADEPMTVRPPRCRAPRRRR